MTSGTLLTMAYPLAARSSRLGPPNRITSPIVNSRSESPLSVISCRAQSTSVRCILAASKERCREWRTTTSSSAMAVVTDPCSNGFPNEPNSNSSPLPHKLQDATADAAAEFQSCGPNFSSTPHRHPPCASSNTEAKRGTQFFVGFRLGLSKL